MAIQNDDTLVTKGDLKNLYTDKIAPYLGLNIAMSTTNKDYYSTDSEKVVGVWIDGKPIYQKVFPIQDYGNKTVNTGLSNIDTLIQLSALCTDGNGTYKLVLSSTQQTGRYIGLHLNGSTYDCYVMYESNSIYTSYGIAQYTKTTDTASSATATPGAYDINFPNTWPENKEIYFGNGVYGYRATGSVSITSGVVKSWDVVPVTRTTNTKIYNYGGTWKRSVAIPAAADTIFGIPLSDDPNINSGVIIGSQAIIATVRDAFTGTATYDFWFTYTK